jgi:hypothetical protein
MRPEQSQYREVLERARKRYTQAVDSERDVRESALLDLQFLAGDQWDEKIKVDRERGPSPRPCLVFNKCLPPVTQLGNQARQNKPAIKINPVDSAGDPDTAKVLQGMIRHIEYDSDADQAYDTALFYAAGCGFGFWRYGCERLPKSFDQEIKYITVEDPFSIYLDCNARKPDRSDMKWAFVIDRMSNDPYEARFGKETPGLSDEFTLELEEEGWADDTSKRVCEYWEVASEKKHLRYRKDDDGTVHPIYTEDLEDGQDPDTMSWVLEDEDDPASNPREEIDEVPVVMQYVINGAEVLEEPARWDGSTIPIVIVTGLEMVVRGKRKIFSMTRFARDPQQLFNFYKTMEAEAISLAPKPKFVGAVGQFRTKRRDWQRANIDNAAYLEFDPIEVGGKQVGEPQWRTFDPPVQALTIGAAAAADDIKASTGYFDPSLGQQKGDQSGVAIGKLQKQGDVSNFHFLDNQARAIKRGGRILVELIPKKYDTDREVRIIGEDQKQRIVRVNAPGIGQDGKPYHYILDAGQYDVRVDVGPSYETSRQETKEMIMALAHGNPEVWQLAADIFFENQDFIGADRLAKRFRATLPPAVAQADADLGGAAKEQQLAAQVAQLTNAAQQMQQQNAQMAQLLQTKILDLESKERIATQNNQAKIFAAEAASRNAQVSQLAAQDHDSAEAELERRAQLVHAQVDVEMAAAQDAAAHAQQIRLQAQQAQAQQTGQGMAQAHDAGMAAQEQGADQQAQETAQQHEAATQQRSHLQALELQQQTQRHQAELATQAQAQAAEMAKTTAKLPAKATKKKK